MNHRSKKIRKALISFAAANVIITSYFIYDNYSNGDLSSKKHKFNENPIVTQYKQYKKLLEDNSVKEIREGTELDEKILAEYDRLSSSPIIKEYTDFEKERKEREEKNKPVRNIFLGSLLVCLANILYAVASKNKYSFLTRTKLKRENKIFNGLDTGARQYIRMKNQKSFFSFKQNPDYLSLEKIVQSMKVLNFLTKDYPSTGIEMAVPNYKVRLNKLNKLEGCIFDDVPESERTGEEIIEIRTRPSNYIVQKLIVDELIKKKFLPEDRIVAYQTSIGKDLRVQSFPLFVASYFCDTPPGIEIKQKKTGAGSVDFEMGFPGIYIGQTTNRYTGELEDYLENQTNLYDKVILIPDKLGNWLIYPEDIRRKSILGAAAADFLCKGKLGKYWTEFKDNLEQIFDAMELNPRIKENILRNPLPISYFPVKDEYVQGIVRELSQKFEESNSLNNFREFIDATVDRIEEEMFDTPLKLKLVRNAYQGNLDFETILTEYEAEFPEHSDEVNEIRKIMQ